MLWAQDLTKAPLNKKALLQHRAPSLGADPASQTAEQRAELDDFEKGQLLDDVSVRNHGPNGGSAFLIRLALVLAFEWFSRRKLHGVLIMDSALACAILSDAVLVAGDPHLPADEAVGGVDRGCQGCQVQARIAGAAGSRGARQPAAIPEAGLAGKRCSGPGPALGCVSAKGGRGTCRQPSRRRAVNLTTRVWIRSTWWRLENGRSQSSQ